MTPAYVPLWSVANVSIAIGATRTCEFAEASYALPLCVRSEPIATAARIPMIQDHDRDLDQRESILLPELFPVNGAHRPAIDYRAIGV